MPSGDYVGAAPAPPEQVTLEVYVEQLAAEQRKYEARVEELLLEVKGCIVARTRICGLPANEVRCAPPLARQLVLLTHAPPPIPTGSRSVDGPQQRALPRVLHAVDEGVRLLRVLVRAVVVLDLARRRGPPSHRPVFWSNS